MDSGQHPPFRTKTIGVRVTRDDYDHLQSLANAQGKPLGEWCRDVLLQVARHPEGSCFDQTLLGEMVAMRDFMAWVAYCFATGYEITSTSLRTIWKDAEESKQGKARNLLREAAASQQINPAQGGKNRE